MSVWAVARSLILAEPWCRATATSQVPTISAVGVDVFGTEVAEPFERDERDFVTGSPFHVRVEQLLRPAVWMRDALCMEYPDLPWFPDRGDSIEACRQVCSRCLVRVECREFVLAEGITHGIWAGVNAKKLRRDARRDAA